MLGMFGDARACSGCSGGCSAMFGGVRGCSGMFGDIRGCSGMFGDTHPKGYCGNEGMDTNKTLDKLLTDLFNLNCLWTSVSLK